MSDWSLRAACRGDSNPDAWFGNINGPSEEVAELKRAKAICKGCTVVKECKELGWHHGNGYGVWGGTRAGKPISLSARLAKCGTVSGFYSHRHRGEPACGDCRAAWIADRGFSCGGPECDHPRSEARHRRWGLPVCDRSRAAAREYRRAYNARNSRNTINEQETK
jgi:WhiB family transcriptional regulator, redox-sensing transcriptional regulator